jgi:hypothetical protein
MRDLEQPPGSGLVLAGLIAAGAAILFFVRGKAEADVNGEGAASRLKQFEGRRGGKGPVWTLEQPNLLVAKSECPGPIGTTFAISSSDKGVTLRISSFSADAGATIPITTISPVGRAQNAVNAFVVECARLRAGQPTDAQSRFTRALNAAKEVIRNG